MEVCCCVISTANDRGVLIWDFVTRMPARAFVSIYDTPGITQRYKPANENLRSMGAAYNYHFFITLLGRI
jgi:hypothetical protein